MDRRSPSRSRGSPLGTDHRLPHPVARGALFAAAGVAGTFGVWAGGIATDRWGADRSLAAGIAAFLAVMAGFTLLWTARPVHIGVIGVLTTIWAGSVFWCSPAFRPGCTTSPEW